MSDYNTRYLVPTFNGLVAQIGLSAGVSVVCLGIFEWNRRKKTLQYLYSPRCRLKVNPSPPMSLKFLGWIIPTINIPEDFYITNVGLDAVMFLRFLKMCLQFCVFNAVVVGTILLPIHYTAGTEYSELPRMSILNVSSDSNVLWAHVFLTYLVTVSWMFLLFKNYWQWMDLRREYTLQRIRQGEIAERSIFISRLPSNLRSDAALKQYFESLKMGPVDAATVVQHCGRLSQKIDRRESALNMLEKAHIELARAVVESIKSGKFLLGSPLIYPTNRPLLSAKGRLGSHHSLDMASLERMIQDLWKGKKQFHKTRKSIFAHKRIASPPAPEPQLNIPLSALSHHSDIIDIYVHSDDGNSAQQQHKQIGGSSLSLNMPQFNIWNALAALDRQSLDKYQPTRPANKFKGGEKVASIDYFVKKYNKLDRKVGELRDGSLRYKSTSFGFVTFKHHLSAQLCAQSKIDSRPQGLSVRLAMEPRDVLWSNLTSSFRNRFSRSVVVNLSIWTLIVFWIFPTSSFLLLTSLAALSAKFKFLQPILDASPLIQSLLQNVLPIVFVTIFLAFAPLIILEISKQELPVSHSALEGNVLRRYYHFLIFNVLFVFMIGTAILKSIISIIQKPTNVFTLLAESLPAGSTFFIFYIVFNTCTHSLELLQVWAQLIIHSFVTARKLTPTPRSLQRATTPWCFQYYYYYPQNILAMVITMIYSVISPLILFAAIAYFAFALLIFKYQFAYCYIRKYENSGRFFRHVFQYTTDGLMIFQITMVGILWLKQAIVGGFFIVALLGFTIYFKIVCVDLFKSRTKYLPLDTGLRNFDNDSSLAMNEIQTSQGGSSQSSNVESGLRRRHGGSCENDGKNVLSSAVEAMASSQGSYSHFRPSVQSDRYEKLDHAESFEEEKQESKQDMEGASPSVIPSTVFTSDELEGPTQDKRGYYTASSGLGLSLSGMMEDVQDVNKSLSKHASKNSLSLRIHTKDIVDPSSAFTEDSTREIKLFTVGDDPMDGPKDADESGVRYSGGFLDEDGFYIENYRARNSTMVPQPLASHFDHTPSKMSYQDRTSDFETYIHPALLKPLNRKMWLPKNPLYDHWDLDDTCEIDLALNSSASQSRLVFRVHENEEDHMQSPSMNRADGSHPQRRNTVGSAYDPNTAGVSLPSPSNWAGCLSDSPPSTAAAVPAGAGSQWDKFDEKRNYQDDTAVNSTDTTTMAQFPGGSPNNQGEAQDGSHTPAGQMMTHSASMSSIRMFSPSSPRVLQPSPQSTVSSDGLSVPNSTRFKRSASMPPVPMSSGEPATGSGMLSGSTSPQVALSPFLSVRSPHQGQHNRSNVMPPQQPQQPGSAGQSPRVAFVQDTSPGNTLTKSTTPLTIRSTMFGAPLLHRHTISHGEGNNVHHSNMCGSFGFAPGSSMATFAATGTVASGVTTIGGSHGAPTTSGSTRKTPARGAGAFFNMLFGDHDDDILDADEKKSRFGYETGGMWAIRRGSVDHHDDDDEDDDDDDSALAVLPTIGGPGGASMSAAGGASGSGGGVGGVGSGVSAEVEGPLGLEELQLAQPSHLDLATTNMTGKTLVNEP
ncbi:hypothetical protein BG006_008005 [Podila minutissima]|uniref:DUF221-domain-containing protein n=1 Tax=Podila minutissima TaxID=64525 RepID=A0A9P5SH28_9FUNG|nr:hypothetical protein BG006_008005 [Podila minutissima]